MISETLLVGPAGSSKEIHRARRDANIKWTKWRPKPTFVWAMVWMPGRAVPGVCLNPCLDGRAHAHCHTLDGIVPVPEGSFVVRGLKGDFTVQGDEFLSEYEPA